MPRILVVEDDPLTLQVLQTVLTEEGYTVVPATDGRAALDYLGSCGPFQPDAIVLDLYLPAVDGMEVAGAYRQMPVRHAPIVVLSAAYDVRQRAAELRAAGALTKPMELDAFLAQVQAAVTAQALVPS
jgi:CheY-like chemotaxis protein